MLANLIYGVTYLRTRHRLFRDARRLATLLLFALAFAQRARAGGGGREFGEHGQWATTFIFGSNKHGSSAVNTAEENASRRSNSFLLETEVVINDTHTIFARTEHLQKTAEDLVLGTPVGGVTFLRLRPVFKRGTMKLAMPGMKK
ncbi:MAG: hypothetical protein ABJC26_16630 [Gemmatimonadaceae bacterium]